MLISNLLRRNLSDAGTVGPQLWERCLTLPLHLCLLYFLWYGL